jgi:VanZ family protein
MNHRTQTLATIAVLLTTLFFGLRPKSFSINNDIQLLPAEHALLFRQSGIAYIDDLNNFHRPNDSNEFTIQLRLAVQNVEKKGFRPILMIHDGSDHDQLTIWQWGTSIIAMNGDDYEYAKGKPRISVKDILSPGKTVNISLTSANHSTKLYIDGQLRVENRNWQIVIPENKRKKRLILGNSVYAKHGWEGSIYSLAIHTKALSAEEVYLRYNQQSPATQLHNNADETPLCYTFTERNERGVADQYGLHIPLLLPEQLIMLKHDFLTMPWHSFRFNISFFADVLLNLLGFIPLGALLYYHTRQSLTGSDRRIRAITFLICFLISFFIEIFQAWQPNRHSSLLDLLLNSVSGYLGIVLAGFYFKHKRKGIPSSDRE